MYLSKLFQNPLLHFSAPKAGSSACVVLNNERLNRENDETSRKHHNPRLAKLCAVLIKNMKKGVLKKVMLRR